MCLARHFYNALFFSSHVSFTVINDMFLTPQRKLTLSKINVQSDFLLLKLTWLELVFRPCPLLTLILAEIE
jgi:hypothetical protein